jgi:CubicO group peptidase (beta-lactamase class C family)
MIKMIPISFLILTMFGTIARGNTLEEKLSPLKAKWTQAMSDLRVPGMAVAVVQNDEIFLFSSGKRDPFKNLPVMNDTVFYIASSTKSFVAMAAMILVEEGKLQLDYPVKKVLPLFRIADPELTEKITLRDLLSHRYGIDSDSIEFGEAFTGQMNEARFYSALKNARVKGSFGYSNLHYTLIGRMIEAASGLSWKDFLEQRIFKPAGLTHTTTSASEMYSLKDVAIGVKNSGNTWVATEEKKTDRTMHAAGGMGSNAPDLAAWILLNLNRGEIHGKRIVRESSLLEMQTSQVAANKTFYEFNRESYGLGWYIGSYKGKKLIHQFGGYEGYRAHVSLMPEEKLGIAVLINTNGYFPDYVAADVYDELLGIRDKDLLSDLKKEAANKMNLQKESSASKDDGSLTLAIGNYSGNYLNTDWGTIRVQAEKNELRAQWGNLNLTFQIEGKDRFKTEAAGFSIDGNFAIEQGVITGLILNLNKNDYFFAVCR